ncbi:MAG: hypothetical protein AAF549_08420 [Pseudomonadota bacterium]
MPVIHLVFHAEKEAEFLDFKIPIPKQVGYGHLFAVLQNDQATHILDIGWQDVESEGPCWRLSRLYQRALRKGYVQAVLQSPDIYIPEESQPAASFPITQDQYDGALQYFEQQEGRALPYSRYSTNCVHYARLSMMSAGIYLGETRGLSAGMYFKRAQKQSVGDLLKVKHDIVVFERTVSIPAGQTVVREAPVKIDADSLVP